MNEVPNDLRINIQMLIEASLQFRESVSEYFYVTEEELPIYMAMEEIINYQDNLIKLATMRPVKIYNSETKTFR